MGSLRYVLRNLSRRRTRTVLGALGILLTIAFLTAIQLGLDSVSTSYVDLVSVTVGKADLVIAREGSQPWSPKPFDPKEALEKAGADPSLAGLSPRLFGLCQVENGGEERFAVLIGIDPARERDLDLAGFRPDLPLRDGKCGLSESIARAVKARVGDKVTVRGLDRGGSAELAVEAQVERQMVLPQQARDFVVVDEAAARRVLGLSSGVHMLAGAFRDPRSYYDARDLHASVTRLKDAGEAIAERLGAEYVVRLPKAAAIEAFQEFSSPVRAVFGVFALLALAIAGLLIYSLVSVSVEERVREYAILRTLGAKRRDVFGLVLAESGLLCLLGVLPGAPVGALLAKVVLLIVSAALGGGEGAVSVPLDLSPAALWGPLVAGAGLAIASAFLPALEATRWSIVDALDPLRRGQIQPVARPEGSANRPLLLTGVALTAISTVVFFILPTALLSGDPSLVGTVVLCLLITILIGMTLVAVSALPVVERVMMRLLGWAFGPVSEMASRNLTRHARRNTTTAVMFTLSVSFVIFIASLVALFSRTSLGLVEQSNGADLRVNAEGPSEGVGKELAGVDGVEEVAQVVSLRGRSAEGIAYDVVLSDIVDMKHVWVNVYGAEGTLRDVVYADRIQYTEGGPDALARLADDDGKAETAPVVLSQSAASFVGVHEGDLVTLSFRLGGTKRDGRFRVAAVCGAFPGFRNVRSRVALAHGAGVILSLESFRAMTKGAPSEAFDATYLVAASDAARQQGVARAIREEFGVRYRFGVESTEEEKEHARGMYWATQVLFGLLLAVAVTVAVFALIASMATAVIERRWEIGVLKALGLRRRQLFRMFLAEAVVLTLSSGLCGGAIGFLLAYLFVAQAAALVEVPIVFTMPYVTFFATFAISVVAGAIAAHLPTRRLLKRTAAEILRAGD